MSNNRIDKWAEVERLAVLPKLRDLLLHGNPIADKGRDDGNWRIEVLKRLPLLKVRAPLHTPRAPPLLLERASRRAAPPEPRALGLRHNTD